MRTLLRELEAEGAIVGNDGEWRIKEAPVVIIHPEFQKLIPPLTKEERSQLEENLLAEGCRDPLTVWKGHNILLDGHNRFEICAQYGIEFSVCEVELADREEAKIWILRNQLGRRNLSPDRASYFRGMLYNSLKARTFNPQGKNQHSSTEVSGQNDHQPKPTKTADIISDQLGVSEKTVRRDAKYADNLKAIATHIGNEARTAILSGEAKLTKKDVAAIADVAKQEPERVKEAFKQTQSKGIVEQLKEKKPVPFPYHVGDICRITAKGEPSLRKYSGCWGVILEAGEFSARVGVWDGEIEAVKPYNLSEYSLSPAQKAEAAQLRDLPKAVLRSRLLRLRDAIVKAPKLETAALAVVADIGKKQRTRMRNSGGTCSGGTPERNVPFPHRELSVEPCLSAIDEKLLGTLEREFLDGQS